MALSDQNTGREHADRNISTDKLTLKHFDLQRTLKYSLNVYLGGDTQQLESFKWKYEKKLIIMQKGIHLFTRQFFVLKKFIFCNERFKKKLAKTGGILLQSL